MLAFNRRDARYPAAFAAKDLAGQRKTARMNTRNPVVTALAVSCDTKETMGDR